MLLKNKIIIYILALFFLWGCSSPLELQTPENWSLYQKKLTELTEFTIRGKLAYLSPKDRVSLSFYWKQDAENYELNLSSFLGGNVLNLKVTPQGALLTGEDDKIYQGTSANRLIYRLTGLFVPADQMKNWIKGLPTGADHYQLDMFNRLDNLTKDKSWQVKYRAYQLTEKMVLPQDIQLLQDKTKIKIIIDTWEFK